jgi:hypothetical protein
MIMRSRLSKSIKHHLMKHSQPPDLSVETVVEVDNVLNPTKRCFHSSLKVLASGYNGKESRTGNYTCKSLNEMKQSSVYRFAHG